MSDWTEERVAMLKVLVEKGFSYSIIAAELGGGITRNAAIGKAKRLGISGENPRGKGFNCSNPRPAARKPRPSPPANRRQNNVFDLKPPRPPLPLPADAPVSRQLSIFELTEHTCKWPTGDVGEPGFHFCGNASLDAAPYCEYHAGVAYQAPQPRQRIIPRADA